MEELAHGEKLLLKYIPTYSRASTVLYLRGETGAETTKTLSSSPMIHERYKQDDDAGNLFN